MRWPGAFFWKSTPSDDLLACAADVERLMDGIEADGDGTWPESAELVELMRAEVADRRARPFRFGAVLDPADIEQVGYYYSNYGGYLICYYEYRHPRYPWTTISRPAEGCWRWL